MIIFAAFYILRDSDAMKKSPKLLNELLINNLQEHRYKFWQNFLNFPPETPIRTLYIPKLNKFFDQHVKNKKLRNIFII